MEVQWKIVVIVVILVNNMKTFKEIEQVNRIKKIKKQIDCVKNLNIIIEKFIKKMKK